MEQPFGPLGSPKYLDYCQDIQKAGTYLDTILSDILEMSRLETGGRRLVEREVDVATAIDEALGQWRQRAADKCIELSCAIGKDLTCAGDHVAIVKVLNNLLSNSVKFTRPHGKVRIRAVGRGNSGRNLRGGQRPGNQIWRADTAWNALRAIARGA